MPKNKSLIDKLDLEILKNVLEETFQKEMSKKINLSLVSINRHIKKLYLLDLISKERRDIENFRIQVIKINERGKLILKILSNG